VENRSAAIRTCLNEDWISSILRVKSRTSDVSRRPEAPRGASRRLEAPRGPSRPFEALRGASRAPHAVLAGRPCRARAAVWLARSPHGAPVRTRPKPDGPPRAALAARASLSVLGRVRTGAPCGGAWSATQLRAPDSVGPPLPSGRSRPAAVPRSRAARGASLRLEAPGGASRRLDERARKPRGAWRRLEAIRAARKCEKT